MHNFPFVSFTRREIFQCPSQYVSKSNQMCINLFQLSLLNGSQVDGFRFDKYLQYLSSLYSLFFLSFSLTFVNNFYLQFYFLSLCFVALLFNINLQFNEIVIHSLIFYDFSLRMNWIIFGYYLLIANLSPQHSCIRNLYHLFHLHGISSWFKKRETFISIIFHPFKNNQCPSTNSINIQKYLIVALLGFDFFGKKSFQSFLAE